MTDDPQLRIGALEVYVNDDGSLYFHADGDLCETVLSETLTIEGAIVLRDLLDQFLKSKPRAPTMNDEPVRMLPGVTSCRHCGDVLHTAEACPEKTRISEACPRCGSGTYVHRDGHICCVNANCSWVKGDTA